MWWKSAHKSANVVEVEIANNLFALPLTKSWGTLWQYVTHYKGTNSTRFIACVQSRCSNVGSYGHTCLDKPHLLAIHFISTGEINIALVLWRQPSMGMGSWVGAS